MKIAVLTPLFDGIIPIIFEDINSSPVGMPAVYKFHKLLAKETEKVLVINILDGHSRLWPLDKNKWKRKAHIKKGNIDYIQLFIEYKGIFKWMYENIPNSKIFGAYRVSKFYFMIKKHIKQFNPDFLYTTANLGFIGGVLSWQYRIPSMLRGYGTLLGTSMNSGDLNSFKYFLKNFLEMYPYKMFRNILMTNDGTKGDNIAKALKVPPSNLHFWMNGIDKSIVNKKLDFEKLKRKFNLPNNKKIIATVSRIDDWKRLDRIVSAMPQIVEQDPNVILVMGGDGQLFEEIKDLVKKRNIQKNVFMLGCLSHEDAITLIYGADIFVSLYDVSNLCNPVLEALLLGKCVISLDDGSLKNIIINEHNGILMRPTELNGKLSSTILDTLNDTNKIKGLGSNAQKKALEEFETWDDRLHKEIQLIKDIIRKNGYARLF